MMWMCAAHDAGVGATAEGLQRTRRPASYVEGLPTEVCSY
jgi:hypothetical protein